MIFWLLTCFAAGGLVALISIWVIWVIICMDVRL